MYSICHKLGIAGAQHLKRTSYSFARYSHKSNSSSSSPEQEFDSMSQKYARDYFEEYRKEFEKDSVIRDFRKQVFSQSEQPGNKEYEQALDQQQIHLQKLLKSGTPEQISKFSKKIMQHVINERKMFKGNDNRDVFKDYADYSAYKKNRVQYEDRNYDNMDNLISSKRVQRAYQFIDQLPENYREKDEVREDIRVSYPISYGDISISQYGRIMQQNNDEMNRFNATKSELSQMDRGKIYQQYHFSDEPNFVTTNEMMMDTTSKDSAQQGVLSSQIMNKIYDLYLEGWTIREISQRFGILPIRTKFTIWARARLYHQFVPKYGIDYLYFSYEAQLEDQELYGTCDYGLDLQLMHQGGQYKEIIEWNNDRVDTSRTPDKYTQSLQKLQENKKFTRYDLVKVGEDGAQNKRYRLTEWRVHRGKGSDEYFLRNKIFSKMMNEKRKTRNVYY